METMIKSDKTKRFSPNIQVDSITCFQPELMDYALHGVEAYNRQLGKGLFRGDYFRASFGSATLDTGNLNHVSTSNEGTLGQQVLFGLELSSTECIQANGEQVGKTNIAVYRGGSEFHFLLGAQNCSWLVFQIAEEKLEEAGCRLPSAPFTLLKTSYGEKKSLVEGLQLLLARLRGPEKRGKVDSTMAEDYLTSLFSLQLSGNNELQRLDKAEYFQIARQLTDYMQAHIDEKISMMDLCRLSGRSESTLRRIFHKIYDISPRHYLTIHRLNAVYRKFRKSTAKDTTVSYTALSYGFLHLGRFSAEYKRHFGEYPSETLSRG
jgi:AraC-like DNA-binding protein